MTQGGDSACVRQAALCRRLSLRLELRRSGLIPDHLRYFISLAVK